MNIDAIMLRGATQDLFLIGKSVCWRGSVSLASLLSGVCRT